MNYVSIDPDSWASMQWCLTCTGGVRVAGRVLTPAANGDTLRPRRRVATLTARARKRGELRRRRVRRQQRRGDDDDADDADEVMMTSMS